MSAPESGSTSMTADPLREEMWTAIVGAGSVTVASLTFDVRICGDPLSVEMIAFADGGADCISRWSAERRAGRARHTLAKCPYFWQEWQIWLNAGHCLRPPWWALAPQPWQVWTHSILTSEFLFYILSSEQSAYFLQFVQLEVQTYTFLCPLLQHEEKRMCILSSLSNYGI